MCGEPRGQLQPPQVFLRATYLVFRQGLSLGPETCQLELGRLGRDPQESI